MLERIQDIRIGIRLAIAYALVLALLLMMVAISGIQTGKLAGITDYYNSNIVPSVDLMRKIVVSVEDVRRFELEHVVAEDIASSTEAEEGIKEARQRLEGGLAAYEAFPSDEEERRLFGRMKTAVAAYLANWDKLKVLSEGAEEDAKKDREAKRLFRESGTTFQSVHKVGTEWGLHKETVSRRYKESSEEVYRSSMAWLAAFAVFALVGGVVSAVVMTRSITGPLAQALGLAQTVAAGDLTARAAPTGHDELADLLRALNNMNRRLVEVVGKVRTGSENVATGAREIATGNSDLSSRTETQASSLEETSSSMDALARTVHQNADTARKANSLARDAAAAAQRGGDSMQEVVAAIQEISDHSHKIADIIAVVDGIAFQTNILALNAAVEAARAGEQGRGFAVVAGEVRALAQRSADAAKDVKNLIVGSVAQVDKGMRMVAQTGDAVNDTVTQVRRVSDMLAEISVASQEQTRSIEQVGRAVAQLEDVTQQNAALVQESAASADSLRTQAQRLVESVSTFKLSAADDTRRSEAVAGEERPAFVARSKGAIALLAR